MKFVVLFFYGMSVKGTRKRNWNNLGKEVKENHPTGVGDSFMSW